MKRALEPIDRLSEVLFGLIMVLTFTGSLSVYEAGREDVRTMLVGALGCNVAWGLIDGVFYLMGCLAEKSRGLSTLRAVREAADPERAQRLIADSLPTVGSVLGPTELEAVRLRLKQLPEPPWPARLDKDDWRGALGVFLLVFLSTFPVTIPFIVMRDAVPALRVSNAIAVVSLFGAGYAFGRLTGRHPVWVGSATVVLGVILVGITIALGG
jgi:VIT1/CCC1 family predicted Fe2+/Mn2+ transporter